MTSVREISRQGQTVPTEYPNVTDHLRMLAREINGLVPHKAIHPVDTPATISATYTMVDSDSLLLCKAENPITIFLLTAAGREGRILTVKKIDAGANPVIVDGFSSETIDNALTVTITAQYSFLTVKSDNANWWSVAQRADVSAGGGGGAPTDATYVTLTTNGTLSAERVLTPGQGVALADAGAGSTVTVNVARVVRIAVSDPNGSAITTGDGKAYDRANSVINGYNLTAVAAHLTTASSSGVPTIQIHNVTQAADMLTTRITIDENEKDSSTAATPAVIDTGNDDVATGDELRIDIDVAGTGAKGLIVDLTFSAP